MLMVEEWLRGAEVEIGWGGLMLLKLVWFVLRMFGLESGVDVGTVYCRVEGGCFTGVPGSCFILI